MFPLPRPRSRNFDQSSQAANLNTRASRRRRRSSSGITPFENPPGDSTERTTVLLSSLSGSSLRHEDNQPPQKRRRLTSGDMRRDPDTLATNGNRSHMNGLLYRKNSQGVRSHDHTQNGDLITQVGRSGGDGGRAPAFFGHDREEVSRLLVQALEELGYHESSSMLARESGYDLESPAVAALRCSVLEGAWLEAESLLFGSTQIDEGGVSVSVGESKFYEGLPLAEGVDKDQLKFQLRRQKYLELLEDQNHAGALMVLRQELTPLHRDVTQLHILSG